MKKLYEIENAIDAHLKKEQDSRKDRIRSGKWSPSSFGRCFRLQCLNRANVLPSNPPDKRALRVFRAGDLFHKFVQDIAKSKGAEIEVEVSHKDIFGYADYVDETSVKDFKSQHSRGFWYMTKKGYDVAKEKLPNWLQVACYASILKKPTCGLVFISKDDLCVSEYEEKTEIFIPPLVEELNYLRDSWENKILPPAEPRAYAGKECQYCQFRDYCKKLPKDKTTLPEPQNVREDV